MEPVQAVASAGMDWPAAIVLIVLIIVGGAVIWKFLDIL